MARCAIGMFVDVVTITQPEPGATPSWCPSAAMQDSWPTSRVVFTPLGKAATTSRATT